MIKKRLIVPIITLVVALSQLTGCAILSSSEMTDLVNSGNAVAIELKHTPSEVDEKSYAREKEDQWIELDKLRTYFNLRVEVERLLYITKITQGNVHSKNGSIYVGKDNYQNGNSSLRDAFRNKAFIEKYWSNVDFRNKLGLLATDVYKELKPITDANPYIALNAYFDVLPDYPNPIGYPEVGEFNSHTPLSRDEFYATVTKAGSGVHDIKADPEFENAIGGPTIYSLYAQETAPYGFLQYNNGSLNNLTYNGAITRAEAVYTVVNKYFKDQLDKVSPKDKAYRDTKNAGALDVRLKINTEGTKKDRWQNYTLLYMVLHPEDGMQEEMYKAMVVSKQLGLLGDVTESRWDEPLTRLEAMELLANVYLAENKLFGYLTTEEYGKLKDPAEIAEEEASGVVVELGPQIGTNPDGTAYGTNWVELTPGEAQAYAKAKLDPDKDLGGGMTLRKIKRGIEGIKEEGKKGGYSEEDINKSINNLLGLYGVTMEDVNSVPDEPKQTTTTTTTNKPKQPATTTTTTKKPLTVDDITPPPFKADSIYTLEEKQEAWEYYKTHRTVEELLDIKQRMIDWENKDEGTKAMFFASVYDAYKISVAPYDGPNPFSNQ